MTKLTRRQIQHIIKRTPQELRGTFPEIMEEFGQFQPEGANWSYRAGWTWDGVLVVTVFGQVK